MLRRLMLLAISAATVWLVATHARDVAQLVTTARGGSWQWLVAAIVLQVGYYSCYVLTYRQAFASAGVHRPLSQLVPAVLASVFVGTVVPSAGAAGPTLIVDDSVRRGNDLAPSAAAALVAQFTDFAGFAVVMAAGFTYLALIRKLTSLEVLGGGLFVMLVAALGAVLALAARRPARLASTLLWLERSTSWASRLVRGGVHEPWAQRLGAEFTESVQLVSRRRRTVLSAWAAAVIGHVLDAACFVAIGFAFGWYGIGALVAAYAVGVVVWLVSFVPQGVGVVEGAIGVLLASLGVPGPTAAAIALTFRGLTFWLPFGIGFVLLPRVSTFSRVGAGSRGRFTARASAVLVFVVGLVNIVSASTPSVHARVLLLSRYLPFTVTYGHLAATLAGVALLLLSRGLWRHKRAAFLLTVTLLGLSALSHLLKGLDYEEAVIALAVMAWLLVQRDTFYAQSDAPSVRQGIRVLTASLIVTLAYGTLGFYLLDRHFSVNFGFTAAVKQTLFMFVYFYDPGLQPITGFGRYFADSVYLVAGATFGFALLMLLRPVLLHHPATASERKKAREIIDSWAHSSIAPMALLPDKTYWFSEGGSVVAYAVAREVAVVLGDPIGPPQDLRAAFLGFRGFADKNGWRVVFYETSDRTVDVYRESGFSATPLGSEAIVRLSDFTLTGKSHKSLRNRVNRLEEDGYHAELVPPPVPPRVLRALRDVSDAWLHLVHGVEKRFALGWFDDEYLRGSAIMVVRDPTGEIVAFANVVGEFRLNEVTIDLMRHRPEAPSGTMDYLFVRLFEWALREGYDTFNLGVSPLAGVGAAPDDRASERLLRLVYEHGNALYGFKGLYAFKQKFDPVWEPRYLVYPEPAFMPMAFAASAHVNSGQNPLVGYLVTLADSWRLKRSAARSPS